MEQNNDVKNEIKISKNEEEETKDDKNSSEKNNSYSKIANISHIENDNNDNNDNNDIEIEIDNDIFMHYNQDNDNELTESQIERLNKIREEVQLRSEKYSELSINSNLNLKNKNNSSISNNITNNDSNDTISQLSHNFINNDYEDNQNNEINPNNDRIFSKIHPFIFINNEPLILLGPDILYFAVIFSISSFFSIIFYSLKKSFFFMKFLYLLGYLFFTITYCMVMILNPGIPTNKNHIDLDELRKNYNQCNICNCIFYKNNDYITFHCNDCNICVEDFDHHCTFAGKCIGKKNKLIFKLWLYSIPSYILIIFLYIIL